MLGSFSKASKNNLMSEKQFAVIIDLNGTLVDTENAFFRAYKDVFAKHDIPFSIEQFTSHWSTQGGKLHDYLEKIHREDLLPQEKELLKEKNVIFQSTLAERAVLMPGAKDLVDRLKAEGLKLGLDSSSAMENIDFMLTIFGLKHTFDAISSGDIELDEEKYGPRKKKSSRMKSLADRLGFSYEHVLVIGDAEKDIKGAKEAGMKAVAVPNQYTKANDFSLADKVVTNLSAVQVAMLEALL
jgi:beta-phosphoglucomutase-like phosphatase (HAD superfamily)